MKVMTVLGTRPEIIRLSRVIPLLDRPADHVLVHTGQNYDPGLSDVFFDELGVRAPDVFLGVQGDTFAEQVGDAPGADRALFLEERPDACCILGDTNSGLVCDRRAAAWASPCITWRPATAATTTACPRRSTGASSTTAAPCCMPYTHRSKENLRARGDRARSASS